MGSFPAYGFRRAIPGFLATIRIRRSMPFLGCQEWREQAPGECCVEMMMQTRHFRKCGGDHSWILRF